MVNSNEASGSPSRRLGSYTTARVTHGRVERLERHAGRLRRDAARLELPLPPRAEIERIFLQAAAAAFQKGHGIVRVEWSHLPGAAPELLPTPRPLGSVPDVWRTACSRAMHPGPEFRANTKYVDVAAYDAGRAEVRSEADFDEVLLFDATGFLVEGARSNFILLTTEGQLVTPDPALGAVEGLGLAIVQEHCPEITPARLRLKDVQAAQEFMSVNIVRGVIPITELDGNPIGSGTPGPHATRLNTPFNTSAYGTAPKNAA